MSFGLGSTRQLSDYGFTAAGIAYELDEVFKDRPSPMTVTAYTPSSVHWKTRLHGVGLEKIPVTYSDADAADPGFNQTKYIVVGVIPCNLPGDDDLRGTKSRSAIGTHAPVDFIKPKAGKLPLRVVAPMSTEEPKGGLKLYALTDADPVTQLCNAHLMSQEVVFYFSEYRNGTTTLADRKKGWNAKVMAVSVRKIDGQFSFGIAASAKHPVQPMTEDLLNKLQLSILSYEKTPLPHTWDRMRRFVDRLTPGNAPIFAQLEWFLNSGRDPKELDQQIAKDLSESIIGLWPDIEDLTAEILISIRRGLVEKMASVDSMYAFAFLSTATYERIDQPNTSPTPLVARAIKISHRVTGKGSAVTQALNPSCGKLASLLTIFAARLRDIRQEVSKVVEELETAHGSRVIPLPTEVLHEQLAHAVDQDTIRLSLSSQCCLLVSKWQGHCMPSSPC